MTTTQITPQASPQPGPGLPLKPGRWTVDPNHSAVHFVVRHLGLSNVRGRFAEFDATLDVGETLGDVSVRAEVDMSSVDTSNADRDAHLRGTDFFDIETNPTLAFRSTGIEGSGSDYELAGELTINGVTKLVTLDVEFFGTEIFPGDQTVHAGFEGRTTIKRSDFGIDFGIALGADKVMLGDKIKVELDLQFVQP